jgi:hypothetical protein
LSRIPPLPAALAAAATLALALGASAGSGAFNPCPGNYDPVTYAAEDKSPDYLEADVNGNFTVCVYQGSNPKFAPVRDDRLPKQ